MRFSGKKSGFSLIELAIVIVIIGIVSAAGISIMSSNLDTAQYVSSKDKITEAMNALRRYYAANGKLPCPADPTVATSSASYGVSILSGACNGVAGGNTVRTEVVAASGNYVRQGALPTRTLGLPDTMMYDDYGRKLTYIVTEKFTSTDGFTPTSSGIITIKDGNSNTVVTNAAVAVISHGKDRKGAYTEAGAIGTACSNTYPLDYENCNQDSETNTSVLVDAQFNENYTNANVWFDDIIKWENKDTVIGLVPVSTGLLTIRFTTTLKDGNIGSVAAADTLCSNEAGSGYTFCTKQQLETYGNLGLLANVSNYVSATVWMHDTTLTNTCTTWSSTSGNGQTLSNSTGKWEFSTDSCASTKKIACCKLN